MVIFQPDLALCVFLCDVSESTEGGLEAGTIPVLNREHTEFACGNLTTVTHTALPCVPSIHFPKHRLPVAFCEIFQALAENCAIHAARRQSDHSCPITMSKTAKTINNFIFQNTHAVCLSIRQVCV